MDTNARPLLEGFQKMGHHRELEDCAGLQYRSADVSLSISSNRVFQGAHPTRCEDASSSVGRLLVDRDEFQIRLASDRWRAKSNKLVERMYSWRGYKPGVLQGSVGQPLSLTVQACNGDQVFG